MFRRHFFAFLTLLLFALMPAAVRAELKLPSLVSDHMVLQRDVPLPIWGWADPDAEVTVAIAGQTRHAKADAEGRWELTLDKLSVGQPQTLSVSSADQVVTVRDVLVGDVWLCSGQSNMAMTVNRVENADQEIAQANYGQIRQFKTQAQARADAPQVSCEGQWVVCSPDTVAGFTAAGYFFGRELHQRLHVPIGLINSSWGGTCVEAWTPRSALAQIGPGRQAIEQYEQNQAKYSPAQAQAQFDRAQDRYQQAVAEYRAGARPATRRARRAAVPA